MLQEKHAKRMTFQSTKFFTLYDLSNKHISFIFSVERIASDNKRRRKDVQSTSKKSHIRTVTKRYIPKNKDCKKILFPFLMAQF